MSVALTSVSDEDFHNTQCWRGWRKTQVQTQPAEVKTGTNFLENDLKYTHTHTHKEKDLKITPHFAPKNYNNETTN